MSKDKLVTQVDLKSVGTLGGNLELHHQMTTWLDADSRIKEGVVITLKDYKPDMKWVIDKVYSTMTKADIDKRGWDNNNYDKHEGLFK